MYSVVLQAKKVSTYKYKHVLPFNYPCTKPVFFFKKKKLTETTLVIIQERDSVCKFSKEHLVTRTILALGNPRVKI